MPNKIRNWNYKQVSTFLREHGFILHHVRGSHHNYVGTFNHVLRVVTVPFHGARAIKPRTMKSIIEQSGIAEKKWFEN